MRTSLYAFAAVALLAVTVPAAAEDLGVHVGGVGVRVGDDHHGDWHRHGWREGRGDHCRTVTVRHRNADGDLVVRKTHRCD